MLYLDVLYNAGGLICPGGKWLVWPFSARAKPIVAYPWQKVRCEMSSENSHIPWRTITLGLHKTLAAYRVALQKSGFQISGYMDDILNKVSIAEQPYDVTLVMRSVADLGFTSVTRYDRICERAKELGLELCPAEVGLALRLTYDDQARGDWFRLAMEPLVADGRDPVVFFLAHVDGGRCLRAYCGDFDYGLTIEGRYVFRLPVASSSS